MSKYAPSPYSEVELQILRAAPNRSEAKRRLRLAGFPRSMTSIINKLKQMKEAK